MGEITGVGEVKPENNGDGVFEHPYIAIEFKDVSNLDDIVLDIHASGLADIDTYLIREALITIADGFS